MARKPDIRFLDDARAFSAENRDRFAFRLLRWYLRCSETEFDLVLRKLYCIGLQAKAWEDREPAWRTYLGILLLPLYHAATKRLFWRAEPRVDFQVETIDFAYLQLHYAKIVAALEGSRRIIPRHPFLWDGIPVAEPVSATVAPRTLLRMALIAPLALPQVAWLSRRLGWDLLAAYRGTLSTYAVFDGLFRRYPCLDFITYADESNHPARYLPFTQQGGRTFYVIQNGERSWFPACAFCMMDSYLTFGTFYADVVRALGCTAREYHPVGGNDWYYESLAGTFAFGAKRADRWDVVIVDQLHSNNGLPAATNAGLDKTLAHLNRFKRERPAVKIAFQLRDYRHEPQVRRDVLARLGLHFTEPIEILENDGRCEALRNASRAGILVGFQSGLLYEAFMVGAKSFFVNYSGNPAQSICPDDRFHVDDEASSYDLFAERLDALLNLEMNELPGFVTEHQFRLDGRRQERIASVITRKAAEAVQHPVPRDAPVPVAGS